MRKVHSFLGEKWHGLRPGCGEPIRRYASILCAKPLVGIIPFSRETNLHITPAVTRVCVLAEKKCAKNKNVCTTYDALPVSGASPRYKPVRCDSVFWEEREKCQVRLFPPFCENVSCHVMSPLSVVNGPAANRKVIERGCLGRWQEEVFQTVGLLCTYLCNTVKLHLEKKKKLGYVNFGEIALAGVFLYNNFATARFHLLCCKAKRV